MKDCTCLTLIVISVSEWKKKTMKSDPSEIYGVFERLNGLSSCIFFHEWNEWKKIQRERPFSLEKRPYISRGSDFIVEFFNFTHEYFY